MIFNLEIFGVFLLRWVLKDALFLDEPTNNLDIATIGWLENQLQHHDGTMVVISHDRHFLNAVCTNILDVDFKKLESLVELMMIGI